MFVQQHHLATAATRGNSYSCHMLAVDATCCNTNTCQACSSCALIKLRPGQTQNPEKPQEHSLNCCRLLIHQQGCKGNALCVVSVDVQTHAQTGCIGCTQSVQWHACIAANNDHAPWATHTLAARGGNDQGTWCCSDPWAQVEPGAARAIHPVSQGRAPAAFMHV